MLQLVSDFKGKKATNSEAGDLNSFLRNVLVEVAGENYRQTMHELMAFTSSEDKDRQYDLDPPLRANERVMSGLFATAISRVALRSRTEARVDRPERESNLAELENEGTGDTAIKAGGRVDYLAWYGQRVIGVELKMAAINCEMPSLTNSIIKRWSTVVKQAQTAQDCLRARNKEDNTRYPNPISLALMVIVGRRSANVEKFPGLNEELEHMQKESFNVLNGLAPKPAFQAIYTFPSEFRGVVRKRKGKEAQKDGHVTCPQDLGTSRCRVCG